MQEACQMVACVVMPHLSFRERLSHACDNPVARQYANWR